MDVVRSLKRDVPIVYLNKTGRNDFAVVVFTKNEDLNAIETPFVAWQIIRAQTSANFAYPVFASVGVYWESNGVTLYSGPMIAAAGSTWEFTCPVQDGSGTLKEDKSAPLNPSGSIVIKNIKPRMWSGRPYNFGLYKCDKLLVAQTEVGVDSQAVFNLTPKVYFGVVTNLAVGKVFSSLSITQNYFEVDLCDYHNGVVVSVEQNRASREFIFNSSHLSLRQLYM